jgi:hypothetical protein
LHFISLAVVSSREDFHLQDRAHAGRTHPARSAAQSKDPWCTQPAHLLAPLQPAFKLHPNQLTHFPNLRAHALLRALCSRAPSCSPPHS